MASVIASYTLAALVCSGAAMAEQRLVTPVKAPCISSPFGPRVLPRKPEAGTYHYGIDLPAPEGAPVLSVASGTVTRVQHKGPGGLEIIVQHGGFVGIYSHLGSVSPVITDGSAITAGEKLGVVGNTGVTYGMHLYFAMIRGDKPVDPATFLKLPLCAGVEHRTQTAVRDADGKILPSRHYYVLRPDGSVARAYLPLNMARLDHTGSNANSE